MEKITATSSAYLVYFYSFIIIFQCIYEEWNIPINVVGWVKVIKENAETASRERTLVK